MVAIDTLNFKYEVIDKEPEDITEGPEDGIYVYGLWMEGARFDRELRLMKPSKLGEMFTVCWKYLYKIQKSIYTKIL